jgi:hypothetical protein
MVRPSRRTIARFGIVAALLVGGYFWHSPSWGPLLWGIAGSLVLGYFFPQLRSRRPSRLERTEPPPERVVGEYSVELLAFKKGWIGATGVVSAWAGIEPYDAFQLTKRLPATVVSGVSAEFSRAMVRELAKHGAVARVEPSEP